MIFKKIVLGCFFNHLMPLPWSMKNAVEKKVGYMRCKIIEIKKALLDIFT
jgi:hypothetical protein